MAKFKITNKTTKDEAARLLGHNVAGVSKLKDKTLRDRMSYTSAHLTEATRKDVIELLKDVMSALGDKFVVPAVADEGQTKIEMVPQKSSVTAENLVKKTKAKTEKAPEETKDTEEEAEETEGETEEKPQPKKGGKKKSSAKKDAVTVLEGSENNPKTVQLAKQFPETITVGGQVFTIHHNCTMDTLADESLEFEIAFYWTKRHLKQFPYFSDLLGHPKSFPNDLDTAQLIYVDDGDDNGENKRVAYAVSDYTRAFYTILPDFLEEIDGMCCGAGIEFQVYSRPVTAEETEDSEEETEE